MGVLDSNIRTSIVLFHDTWSSVPHLDTLTSWVLWISTPSRLPIERRGDGANGKAAHCWPSFWFG